MFATIYEQDSLEPVARLAWLHADLLKSANDEIIKAERESWEPEPKLIPNIQIYHFHNDHLGTPNELTSQDGQVVWLADYEAWGNTAKVVWREEKLGQLQVTAEELQPIRFQGQSFDVDTGLHYNRFRYFDPDLGMFTTRDPIGLLGGNNVFQYAPNPTGWVDPWGLAKKKPGDCNCDDACPHPPKGYNTYYHYTNELGMRGIVSSRQLHPSIKANNPKDARYGDGQYISNIVPGTKSNSSLSATFIGIPFQGAKFSHYIAIDTTGLEVIKGRNSVYLIPNDKPLDLTGRIRGFGKNC